MAKTKTPITIGIDEVGRGALAGPVTVAVLALPQKSNIKNQISKLRFKNKRLFLKDSKGLTSAQREIIFKFLKREKIPYAVAGVSPKIIDKINISQAANLAAGRAFQKLTTDNRQIKNCEIFLDGGLYLPENNKIKNLKPKTVVKGDEKIPAIALASIAAKVTRDRYMKKLHKKYPHYDFINNVGYGAKKHITAVKKYGRSLVHRKSFKIKN